MDPDNIDVVNEQISKLQEIVAMSKTPGWKHIVASTEMKMQAILAAMLKEQDATKIMRFQEKYFAFSSTIEGVKECEKELELKQAELRELEEFKQYGQAGRPQGE